MTTTATQPASLITFTLPSTPYSVRIARFYVRAALRYHNLGDYAEDAETITAELTSNVIQHAAADAFALNLMRLEGSGAIAVIVTDPCPSPPIQGGPAEGAEHGRGLHMVAAISAHWGWAPQNPGKSVYAILAAHERGDS
jgi:anti-sigma regulatory factor (Ser/Thr protein kinase)